MKSFSLAIVALSSATFVSALNHLPVVHSPRHPSAEVDSAPANTTSPEMETFILPDTFTIGMMGLSDNDYGAQNIHHVEGPDGRMIKRGTIALDDAEGSWGVTRSVKRMAKMAKGLVKRGSLPSKVEITWYSGNDLKNPGCQNKSKWQPNDSTLIFATKESSSVKCGAFYKLCTSNKKKCVTVRKWDFCEACELNHIDLSPAAFNKLYAASVGEVNGVLATSASTPNPYTSSDTKLYGPKTQ